MNRKVRIISLLLLGLLLIACSRTRADIHTGRLALSDGRSFTCTMNFPQSWAGKYEVREAGNIAWFDYSANPDLKYPLFALAALTQDEWVRAQQEVGHGELLLSQDGAVFVYNIALENLYSGSQAEEFQRMAGEVQAIVATLQVAAVE